MQPHVHVGLVEFLIVAAYVVIFTWFWRIAAAHLNDKYPHLAAGMAAVYS